MRDLGVSKFKHNRDREGRGQIDTESYRLERFDPMPGAHCKTCCPERSEGDPDIPKRRPHANQYTLPMVKFRHPNIGWDLDELPDEVKREREERDIKLRVPHEFLNRSS